MVILFNHSFPSQNVYWQVGDVVSVLDEEDGDVYYAQLQGFFQSENFSKSAMVSWLLPGPESPEQGFDPKTYTLGELGAEIW